jgi:hypothetical protein
MRTVNIAVITRAIKIDPAIVLSESESDDFLNTATSETRKNKLTTPILNNSMSSEKISGEK